MHNESVERLRFEEASEKRPGLRRRAFYELFVVEDVGNGLALKWRIRRSCSRWRVVVVRSASGCRRCDRSVAVVVVFRECPNRRHSKAHPNGRWLGSLRRGSISIVRARVLVDRSNAMMIRSARGLRVHYALLIRSKDRQPEPLRFVDWWTEPKTAPIS